jgi:methionine synthase I (cobalamin-dependent)
MSADVIIYAEPNSGKPELVDNQAVYKVSSEDFAASIEKIYIWAVFILLAAAAGAVRWISRQLLKS